VTHVWIALALSCWGRPSVGLLGARGWDALTIGEDCGRKAMGINLLRVRLTVILGRRRSWAPYRRCGSDVEFVGLGDAASAARDLSCTDRGFAVAAGRLGARR